MRGSKGGSHLSTNVPKRELWEVAHPKAAVSERSPDVNVFHEEEVALV